MFIENLNTKFMELSQHAGSAQALRNLHHVYKKKKLN